MEECIRCSLGNPYGAIEAQHSDKDRRTPAGFSIGRADGRHSSDNRVEPVPLPSTIRTGRRCVRYAIGLHQGK